MLVHIIDDGHYLSLIWKRSHAVILVNYIHLILIQVIVIVTVITNLQITCKINENIIE